LHSLERTHVRFQRGGCNGAGFRPRRLRQLKTLAGEWRGKIDKRGEGDPIVVTNKVTTSGHAVVETFVPGSEHEMVTVYHLDRDKLVLTHYCAADNRRKWP
jgi:hypothetical protein